MFDETHVLDLLPAYALGILDADEADHVEEHLLSCWICRAEASTFQDTAEELSFAAPVAAPSPDLKDRLLQRVPSVRPQPRIPAQAAIVDERGRKHCGHRFGDGADHEQGVGRDRLGAAELLDSEAAEIGDLAVLNNGNRGARYPEPCDCLG